MTIVFPIVYDRPTGTSGGPQPGATALMRACLARWAPRATNLGIYNPRNVRGGTTLSTHAEGRAIDVGFPYTVGGTPDGWDCANSLRIHAPALGVQQIIYARRVWRNTLAEKGWRPYNGTAAHYEHVHAELTRQAARQLTAEHIAAVFAGQAPAPAPAPTPPSTDEDETTMLRDFIELSYTAAGRDPAQDQAGVAYWFHKAASEAPETHWTYGVCRRSPTLAYMVSLLK